VVVSPIEESANVVVKSFERFGRRERLAVQAIRKGAEHVPIVVVLQEISLRAVHDAIDAGAQSVVWASGGETSLEAAIHAARSGLVSFPAEVRERFARPALSAREKQVLGLVVMGLGNAEIGSTLHIAQTTVKTHLASIFEKLGVRSRNEAVSVVLDPVQGRGLGVLAITQGPVDE
jgi:DNA-binding NarL/FixJ family response regulator